MHGEKNFIKRVIKLSSTSKGITLPEELGLDVGKVYQWSVEEIDESSD